MATLHRTRLVGFKGYPLVEFVSQSPLLADVAEEFMKVEFAKGAFMPKGHMVVVVETSDGQTEFDVSWEPRTQFHTRKVIK